jgi:plasmid replication initiation protein
MTGRRSDDQFDLFVPYISDLPIRDQRETMERPFFSLSKSKRLKPIEYTSPNGEIFVNVFPNPEFGMATIWDADILIWAASVINDMKNKGSNEIPRTLHFQPFDLLKTICRETGGREYRLLREGLGRLQATTIVTNIRVRKGKKHRQFSWIESWTDLVDDDTQQSRGMSLTLSDWFYEGILMDGGILAIDPSYFSITGGRERWLYRVARKHAGGAGEEGFAIPFPTLFDKSGAEGNYRRFKFELMNIVKRNELPEYELFIETTGAAEPLLRMCRRDAASLPKLPSKAKPPKPDKPAKASKTAKREEKPAAPGPLFTMTRLDDETISRVRKTHPGWDVYALKAEFDIWVDGHPERTPRDYQAAFIGFVQRFCEREGRS